MHAPDSVHLYLGYVTSHHLHNPYTHVVNGRQQNVLEGYHPEAPRRANSIFEHVKAVSHVFTNDTHDREATTEELLTVHSPQMIEFLSSAWNIWSKDPKSIDTDKLYYNETFNPDDVKRMELVPECWPYRSKALSPITPKSIGGKCGLYATDTCTPIGRFTHVQARKAAALALDVTKQVISGEFPLAYALCRPPGHHSARNQYGGYCYFNNSALATQLLVSHAKDGKPVGVLDIDYHHGNGTQDIFYESDQVMFVSIHADPNFEFPFFSGSSEETGSGNGVGWTKNIPLPAETYFDTYEPALDEGIKAIQEKNCGSLVVSFGIDAADGDPLGTFHLKPENYFAIGVKIGKMNLPTVIVAEGGYSPSETLGACASELIRGVIQGYLAIHNK